MSDYVLSRTRGSILIGRQDRFFRPSGAWVDLDGIRTHS